MGTLDAIIGVAARFLHAAGVPQWAVYAGCIVLAVLYVLAPKAGAAIWAAILAGKVEKPTDVDEGGKVIDHGSKEGGGPVGGGPTGGMG